MAYTTENLVEDFLKRDLTASEVTLLETVLIPAVKQFIDRYTSSTYDDVSATSRYYDGECTSVVDIDPCTAITAVALVDEDQTLLETLDSNQYVAYPINATVKKYLKFRNFNAGKRLAYIKVTAKFSEYDSGVPTDIQLAATKLAAHFLTSGETAGVQSESIEGHSITYDVESIAMNDPVIKSALDLRKDILVG